MAETKQQNVKMTFNGGDASSGANAEETVLRSFDQSLVDRALTDESDRIGVNVSGGADLPKSIGAAVIESGPLVMKPASEEETELSEEEIASRQRKKEQADRKSILLTCEPVLMVNFATLSMDDYPSDRLLAEATRFRDVWVTGLAVFSSVLLISLWDLAPAWVGGSSFGLLFVTALLGWKPVRSVFYQGPVRHEVLRKRQMIEFKALGHIRLLEGREGLAWRLERLIPYNNNLKKRVFVSLMKLSKNKKLTGVLHSRRMVRAYMHLMTEAQLAYELVQKEFHEAHKESLSTL